MNRILFLSNDLVLRKKNIDVLTHGGFEVTEASDALQGLLMVEGDGFDAIIIDEKLSDIDGYRASRKIRDCSEVPVILLGTESAEKVWDEVDDLGFDIYLKKPLYPRELMCFTKAILRRSRLQKPAQEVNPAETQATPVAPVPLSEVGPIRAQATVESQKPAEKGRTAKIGVEPTVADKAASKMRAKPPMTAEVAHAPVQAESIEGIVTDLERQFTKIKTAIVRIGQLQKTIEEVKTTIHQQQQDLRAVENQLQEVSDQLEDISGRSRVP